MDNKFMQEAIKEAYKGIFDKEGGPFGSVIVKDNKIVGRGHNQVLKNNDCTCHGEIQAIRDASKNLNTFDLSGCELYTTAAPCPMCTGAIQWANIDTVYYGCTLEDSDSIGFRDVEFQQNKLVYKELNREQCLSLFKDYVETNHLLY